MDKWLYGAHPTSTSANPIAINRRNSNDIWPAPLIGYTFSMVRLLSVYLAATILACPLLCQPGQCSAADDGADSGRRCCCCHGSGSQSPEEQPTAPERRSSDSGGCCQCICGGAVVGDAGAVIAEVDTSWWSPVAILIPVRISPQSAQFDWLRAAPWPDDDMNVGRALRCRYGTLLC